ncbi:MAG: anti-sigma factor family protein [Terriglobales bacterium]
MTSPACARYRPALSAYLDGELEPWDSGGLIRHLEACPHCAAELADFRALGALMRDLPAPPPPPDLALRLRVEASHYSVRGERWEYWKLRLTTAFHALAMPAAVGTAVALCLFSALAGGVRTKSAHSSRPDVQVGMDATPPRLINSSGFGVGGSVVVEAQIDSTGHVYGYNVLSGAPDAQVISRLNNQLLLSVFQPATTIFGQPTNGHLVVSFGTVDVRG